MFPNRRSPLNRRTLKRSGGIPEYRLAGFDATDDDSARAEDGVGLHGHARDHTGMGAARHTFAEAGATAELSVAVEMAKIPEPTVMPNAAVQVKANATSEGNGSRQSHTGTCDKARTGGYPAPHDHARVNDATEARAARCQAFPNRRFGGRLGDGNHDAVLRLGLKAVDWPKEPKSAGMARQGVGPVVD